VLDDEELLLAPEEELLDEELLDEALLLDEAPPPVPELDVVLLLEEDTPPPLPLLDEEEAPPPRPFGGVPEAQLIPEATSAVPSGSAREATRRRVEGMREYRARRAVAASPSGKCCTIRRFRPSPAGPRARAGWGAGAT
jgi:hypothetical protein